VAYEDVTVACGHVERFGLWEDKKDRYRKERRAKLVSRPCQACRAQRQQEEQQAAQQRRQERRRGRTLPERLPDRSRFEVVYDAATQSWSGTLTVGTDTFTDTAGGVFRLLELLDRQYRDFQAGTLVLSPSPGS
jgi:hypothetical protein